MARHGVAANLLMFFIVAAGLVSMGGLVQEAFPVLAFDFIEVSVPYPGATPDEIEESIILRIEERLSGLNGVRDVSAVAGEGLASVMAGLKTGTNIGRALADIEAAVNRIQTFPAGAERPEIRQMTNRQSVIRLALYGDVSERALKEAAYRLEEDLAALPEVSYVQTSGVRQYEISIEVSRRNLRALGLTLDDIATAVRDDSLDLSAGSVETRDANVGAFPSHRRRGLGHVIDHFPRFRAPHLRAQHASAVSHPCRRLDGLRHRLRHGHPDVDGARTRRRRPAARVPASPHRPPGRRTQQTMKATPRPNLKTPPGPRGRRLANARFRWSDGVSFLEQLNSEYGEVVSFQLPGLDCCGISTRISSGRSCWTSAPPFRECSNWLPTAV